MIRKEEDGVGLTAAGFYSAFRTQTESRATSAQYNTVHKQYKLGLSRAKRGSTVHSPVSSLSLSPFFSFPGPFYAVSPRHLLEQDTGVCHLHLTHLLTACLPTLSPAADLAEPRPPRHNPVKKKQCILGS